MLYGVLALASFKADPDVCSITFPSGHVLIVGCTVAQHLQRCTSYQSDVCLTGFAAFAVVHA